VDEYVLGPFVATRRVKHQGKGRRRKGGKSAKKPEALRIGHNTAAPADIKKRRNESAEIVERKKDGRAGSRNESASKIRKRLLPRGKKLNCRSAI